MSLEQELEQNVEKKSEITYRDTKPTSSCFGKGCALGCAVVGGYITLAVLYTTYSIGSYIYQSILK